MNKTINIYFYYLETNRMKEPKFEPISNIIESSSKLFLIMAFSSKPLDMR